jgi:hypothetical protein
VKESPNGLKFAEKIMQELLPSWKGQLTVGNRFGNGSHGPRMLRVDLKDATELKQALSNYLSKSKQKFDTLKMYKGITVKKFLTVSELRERKARVENMHSKNHGQNIN